MQGNACHAFSGLLTKKFINLIKHAEDGMLDLNNAAETLEVNLFALCVFYWLCAAPNHEFSGAGAKEANLWHY